MMTKYQEIITPDGSKTIVNLDLNEVYHSRNGAVTESELVYIQNGLACFSGQQLNILEVGYGTGLNALLSFRKNRVLHNQIDYHGLDVFPLPVSTMQMHDYLLQESIPDFSFSNATAAWEKCVSLSPDFRLTKHCVSIQDYETTLLFDIVYFDAFSPEKQPEMWSLPVFKKLFDLMTEAAVLLTYSSKGIVKQALRDAGFIVERLPGPPPKHHVLRARKSILK